MRVSFNGREATKLVPADRVVPGDEVIYTLEIRNTGAATVPAPERAVSDSRTHALRGGFGGRSRCGGELFGRRRAQLRSARESPSRRPGEEQPRPATAADYTHIRWQFKHGLKGNSVAFARFRAVVK